MPFASLQSGVQYDTKMPSIQKGADSIYGAMGQIVGMKIQDEQSKQKMYEELLNIGLEEVKGKYQDEASKIKSDLLKRTAQIFAEGEGMPSAEQLKEINAGRGKLTNYAKMYKGMEDWYVQSSMQAAKIPSKIYRDKTIKNIADIMNQPTLTQTWDQILSKPWLEMPPPVLDMTKIRKGILESADEVNVPYEAKYRDKYGYISYEAWKSKNPNQVLAGIEDVWEHMEGVKERFPDIKDLIEYVGTGQEVENKIVHPPVGKGSTETPKKKVYYNEGTRAWEFSDLNSGKGIQIADFTPEGSKTSIKNASITRIFVDKNTGQLNAKVVSPSIQQFSYDDYKAIFPTEAEFQKFWQRQIALYPTLMDGKSSTDPLNLQDFYVPYYMVSSFTERYIDLRPKGEKSNSNPDNLNL